MIAVLIAKLVDPVILIVAGLGGSFSVSWRHVLFSAFVASILDELVLSGLNRAYQFNGAFLLMGVLAGLFWGALAFTVRQAQRKRRQPEK